jgi:hypothetical protein
MTTKPRTRVPAERDFYAVEIPERAIVRHVDAHGHVWLVVAEWFPERILDTARD